jgi:hypothetical protein
MALFRGVVEGDTIRTGDSVIAVDATGAKEPATITGVMVDDPTEGSMGARLKDVGEVGQAVRLMVRRRKPAIADTAVVAFEKP